MELNNDETLKAIRASIQEDADEDPEINVDEIMEGIKQSLIDIENGNVTPYVITSKKAPPMTTTPDDDAAAVIAALREI